MSSLLLHHLDYSRGTRIIWLLEEANVQYNLVRYQRKPGGPAPAALKLIHPTGKSPVIEDKSFILAESSAILRYINRKYCGNQYYPESQFKRSLCDEIVDFIEPTVMPAVITAIISGGRDVALFESSMATFEENLLIKEFLQGNQLTLADFQMIYPLALACEQGILARLPHCHNYYNKLLKRPALQAALAKGGAMC